MHTTSRNMIVTTLLLYLVTASVQSQTISYIIPDIGSPGMNTLVEFIGPHDAVGNFGSDGLYMNNPGDALRLRCVNPGDSNTVIIGPFVVSWDGRMISAQIFVNPDANPPSSNWQTVGLQYQIPIEFVRNGSAGNAEMFYVVRPQAAIVKSGDGTLGSGGSWGLRSPRGAMIVDSLVLMGDNYDVSLVDPDLTADGNQGNLPVTIISRGPVRMGSNTTLSVDANGKHGGPGGGGGGGSFCDFTGDGSDGGDGFTGGGRGGRNKSGNPFGSDAYRNPGIGSGAPVGNTGGSLNGVSGGTSPAHEASGGGTGHPFGTSGEGCSSGSGCNPPGGFGGGSGQQQLRDGGGGGYATPGVSSNNGNGGQVHGNAAIIPLAGGSGGASGNPQLGLACSGEGGGGAGALKLSAPSMETYHFTAFGGSSGNGSSTDGGAGSGGAIHIGSKLLSSVWKIEAPGGLGPGKFGGAGRIRMDGPLGWTSGGLPVEESMFTGPSTDTSTFVPRTFTLTGTGNGEDIHLYMKSDRTQWAEIAVLSGYGTDWTHDITLTDEGYYYLAALQTNPSSSSAQFTASPAYIPSQSAANIFIFRPVPEIAAAVPLTMPGLRCEQSMLDTVIVENLGDGTLNISAADFAFGDRGFTLVEPAGFPVDILPGGMRAFIVRHDRVAGSRGVITDTLKVTSNSPGASPFTIPVSITVDVAEFMFASSALAFPDILLCEGSQTDTSIVLTNTGTIPLRLELPVIDNTAFILESPQPTDFPVTLQPDSTLELQLRVDHAAAGTETGTLTLRSVAEDCAFAQQLDLSASARNANLFVGTISPFSTLQCPGESTDNTMLLRNDGEVPITVTTLSSTLPQFTVISPLPPFSLDVNEQVVVIVRFAPQAAGQYNGALSIVADPCAVTESRVLTGSADSLNLVARAMDFGLHRASTLPATASTTLHNTGSVPVTVNSMLDIPPFRVTGGIPVTIAPGDSAVIDLEFDDPGADGTYVARLPVNHAPACNTMALDVQGRVATARVVVSTDTIVAEPSEVIELPIYLSNAENLQLFGATSITVNLRYNASLMVPLSGEQGSIVGDERVLPLDLPLVTDANGVAMRVPFMVTLGLTDETPILISDVIVVGGQLTVVVEHGQLTVENICREGGDRFFDGSGQISLEPNRPNPFNPTTEIAFEIIEAAPTQLLVFDALGRRVATLQDGLLAPGKYIRRFDASGLPSGVYFSVLKTPTVTRMRRMLFAK
ncbi:hypothetical protein KQI65_02565 [bacterium]|nr:hypothetical protein [bacterium]